MGVTNIPKGDTKFKNIMQNYSSNMYDGASFQSHLRIDLEQLGDILGESTTGQQEVVIDYLTGKLVSFDAGNSEEFSETCVKLSFNLYEAARNSLFSKKYNIDENRALYSLFEKHLNIKG